MKKILLVISLIGFISIFSHEVKAAKIEETFSENSTVVNISADASVKGSPDLAVITAGVETEKPSAEEAFNENSNKMKRIYDALQKAGIEEKDIRTSNISLFPYREYNSKAEREYIRGYRASNNLTVRFRDIKAVGKVIDALISQGANNLNGPVFSIENPDELLEKARVEAMKKAMARAKTYADTAGLKVKRVVRISESHHRPAPMLRGNVMMKTMAMDSFESAPTPIAAGEEELNITINVEFELTK